MDHHLAEFETWMRSWSAAENTIEARLSLLRALLRHIDDPLTVSTEELASWLGNPAWSGWTRVAYFGHAHSYWEWLRTSKRRATNPMADLKRPQPPKNKPRPLTAVQEAMLKEKLSGHALTWALLGLLAGMRAFEAAKLRGEDITEDSIYIVGKGGKAALVPTHPDLWALAQQYPRHGFWFPSKQAAAGHVNRKTVTNALSRALKDLGIPGAHHRLRHTYGTTLLRNGTNVRVVQELLRHDSLASTQKYTEVADDEKRRAILGLAA